jgi:diguanylate cyclase (GGDEF)-like protein/PAS domain S-box-containing protein
MQDNENNVCGTISDQLILRRKILNTLSSMIAYWNKNEICLFANSAYLEWFGKTDEEMIGISLQALLGPLYEKNLPYITNALNGKQQVFERMIPLPDGTIRHSLANYYPDIADGQVTGFIAHVVDISYLKKIEEELMHAKEKAEQLATHDALTGLANRNLLEDRISMALATSQRLNNMVALMTLDMDGFKIINDTYGHPSGDQLLIEVSRRIGSVIRNTDTFARIGGDEFIILAPIINSIDEVRIYAERIFSVVQTPFIIENNPIDMSFSIGVALYPRNGSDVKTLFTNSDKALYHAKKSGKNKYVFAE